MSERSEEVDRVGSPFNLFKFKDRSLNCKKNNTNRKEFKPNIYNFSTISNTSRSIKNSPLKGTLND